MYNFLNKIKEFFNPPTRRGDVPIIHPPQPEIVKPPLTTIIKETNQWLDLKPINLSKINPHPLDSNLYFKEIQTKKQITLHHTVSGDGVWGDISTWESDPRRIATCIIIDRMGVPHQLFSSQYWAGHLGVGNLDLDRMSIGIELDNWGWLIRGNGYKMKVGDKFIQTKEDVYYTYYGNIVDVPIQVYSGGFRGYNYYEKYTDQQIETVGELLLLWNKRYDIPLTYQSDMWDVSPRALNGEPGVWTHVSYRPPSQKTDCHPQPNLVEMLKSLSRIII